MAFQKLFLIAALSAGPILADMIPYTGTGPTQYTVSTSGIYQLTAVGGSGGNAAGNSGGLGISISADFNLTAGEVVDFYVGGGATNSSGGPYAAAGGGGGTFIVVDSDAMPLLIAGGGGGAGNQTNGLNATISESGTYDGYTGNAGGTNGGAGSGELGGSGFYGTNNPGCGFPNLCGGGQLYEGSAGGYGGGSGGGNFIGGGGGGYSGGGGGYTGVFTGSGGGGGGSYVDASALSSSYVTAQAGNGSAEIDLVQASAPEPGTVILVLFGFMGIWFCSAHKLARRS